MNKPDYQKKLDAFIAGLSKDGTRPRLLVHCCCAPCSSYVMEYLSDIFDMTMYFYNPNIDSQVEYEKRENELQRLISEGFPQRIKLVSEGYDPENFEKIASGHEDDPERGDRCKLCYRLRLEKTARFLQEFNLRFPSEAYDFFATTLTLSPLKDAQAINEIGDDISSHYGIKYLETDFKKKNGFKRSIELSREYNLYRQNYCGCRFSKRKEDHKT